MKNKIQYKLFKKFMLDTFLLMVASIIVQVALSCIFENIKSNTLLSGYIDLSSYLWNKSGELLIYYEDIIRIFSLLILLIPYSILIITNVKKLVVNPMNQIMNGLSVIDYNNLYERLDVKTEYEFTDLKNTFNSVLEKLEKASSERDKLEEQKNLLITGVSHDLKTPITTIRGYSQALNENMIKDEKQKKEYLLAINKKSIQLDNLISLLFDYVKLTGTKNILKFEEVDLIELIRENLALFYTDFEEKGIHFDFVLPEDLIIINGDKEQLNRVFANIYSNALKCNKKGDTVSTRIDLTHGIAVYIEDTGDKISESIIKNIFEPFVTGDESRKTGSGTGLGLSIASKIMELHKGSISLIQKSGGKYTKSFVIKFDINNNID